MRGQNPISMTEARSSKRSQKEISSKLRKDTPKQIKKAHRTPNKARKKTPTAYHSQNTKAIEQTKNHWKLQERKIQVSYKGKTIKVILDFSKDVLILEQCTPKDHNCQPRLLYSVTSATAERKKLPRIRTA